MKDKFKKVLSYLLSIVIILICTSTANAIFYNTLRPPMLSSQSKNSSLKYFKWRNVIILPDNIYACFQKGFGAEKDMDMFSAREGLKQSFMLRLVLMQQGVDDADIGMYIALARNNNQIYTSFTFAQSDNFISGIFHDTIHQYLHTMPIDKRELLYKAWLSIGISEQTASANLRTLIEKDYPGRTEYNKAIEFWCYAIELKQIDGKPGFVEDVLRSYPDRDLKLLIDDIVDRCLLSPSEQEQIRDIATQISGHEHIRKSI